MPLTRRLAADQPQVREPVQEIQEEGVKEENHQTLTKPYQNMAELMSCNPFNLNKQRLIRTDHLVAELEQNKEQLGSFYYYLALVELHNKEEVAANNFSPSR